MIAKIIQAIIIQARTIQSRVIQAESDGGGGVGIDYNYSDYSGDDYF